MNVFDHNINEESKLQINFYKKQELERNQLLQQLKQPDTKLQLLTIKKVPLQQVAIPEFSIPTPFVFPVITVAISFTENILYISRKSSPFEKNWIDIFPILPIREHHDSYFVFHSLQNSWIKFCWWTFHYSF